MNLKELPSDIWTARRVRFPGMRQLKKKKGVGGWGPRYLAMKRERGPVRVPQFVDGGL